MRNVSQRAVRAKRGGFTLIELLVAMAILMILVMIVAQLFQQARQAWETGTRKAEMNMKGRALADYMAQELSCAIQPTGKTFSVSMHQATFWVLGDTTNGARAAQQVVYDCTGGAAKRNTKEMCDSVQDVTFTPDSAITNGLPLYVDVSVTVSDGGSPATNKVFESRAMMINRKRYSMD